MNASSLATVDIIVLSIVGLSVLFAFFKGFVASVLSFLAWLAAFVAAIYFRADMAVFLKEHVKNPVFAQVVAGSAVFFIVFIILAIINGFILRATKEMRLGVIDRSLGVALGVFRGGFIVSVFLLLIVATQSMLLPPESKESPVPKWLSEAKTYPLISLGGRTLVKFLSKKHYDAFVEAASGIEDQVLLASLGKNVDFSAVSNPHIFDDLIQQLPEEKQEKLYANQAKNATNLGKKEEAEFHLDALKAYREAAKAGILKGEALSLDTISALEKLTEKQLKQAEKSEDVGYKKKQQREFDDLINNLNSAE